MLRTLIAFLLFITSSSAMAQTNADRANLEAAFRQLDQGSRQAAQHELHKSNLYHQTVDGLWGNGTESALLAAYHALNEYDLGLSMHTQGDARYLLNFIIVGSAQKFLVGEGNECDGCDIAPATPTVDTTIAANGLPRWILETPLPHNASIGQWLNATAQTRLATAGNYFAQLRVPSNNQLSELVRNGRMLEYAQATMNCTNDMVNFGLQTGQKNRNNRVTDMIRICAFN